MRVLSLLLLLVVAGPALAQPAGLTIAPVGSADNLPVSAYFQPFDDSETVALRELSRAQRSVRIAQYNIRNTRFYDALVALRARGVEVKIDTDKDNAAHPWNWLTGHFLANGFDLFTFKPPTGPYAIMHLKACVIDSETVLTGSYNWNTTAQLSNDENMIVIKDAKVAAEYERYMACIRSNTVTTWRPKIPAGSPIEVHFAPADKPANHVEKLIKAAKSRVTVSMFAFTDKVNSKALEEAARRGVTVEVVLERKQAAISPVSSALMAAGARVVIGANETSSFSSMHHKYAVIDEDIVVTGACNWTKNGFVDSCEDVVILRDKGLARAFRHNWKALIKRYDPLNYDPYLFLHGTPEAHVEFVARHDRTAWGDRVVVVGNCAALGDWDPRNGVELRTADDIYPQWSASVALPAGARIEYKYVTLTAAGETFWEHGDNRVFTVDALGTDEARIEAYRFP
jgi:phosphatidylserine/phosphatidylglycerophosphate/cardiolipin synthase-like enzyme